MLNLDGEPAKHQHISFVLACLACRAEDWCGNKKHIGMLTHIKNTCSVFCFEHQCSWPWFCFVFYQTAGCPVWSRWLCLWHFILFHHDTFSKKNGTFWTPDFCWPAVLQLLRQACHEFLLVNCLSSFLFCNGGLSVHHLMISHTLS